MATLLLVAHGLTTGTFTSPHLERIEERIALNGLVATPEQFTQAVADVAVFADIFEARSGASLTYFELTAAIGFAWFADQAADAAVVEVGLGGRLDATNACTAEVAVLTGVGLEHQQYLGDTIQEIATEKLAIVQDEATLVTGPLPAELDQLVNRVAAEHGARLRRFGADFGIEDAAPALGGWQVDVSGIEATYPDLYLPIHGRHQLVNLAVAVASVEALTGRALDQSAVANACSAMASPGRMEPVSTAPLVLLDGAHNPAGFAVLGEALREEFANTRWVLLTGAMADKDLSEMYPHLADLVEVVVATGVDSPNAIPAADLAARLHGLIAAPIEAIADPAAAFRHAVETAGETGSVLVAGSLYLVGAIRALTHDDAPAHRNER
jgi:dihydrofolate synthase/folylpolyglutamate synthase